MKKHFIYQDEKSHKFWDIEIAGNEFTVTFGKIGTAGTTQTKTWDSEEKCEKEAEKLLAEKLKKGYQEEGKDAISPKDNSRATSEFLLFLQNPDLKKIIPEKDRFYDFFKFPVVSKRDYKEFEKKFYFEYPKILKNYFDKESTAIELLSVDSENTKIDNKYFEQIVLEMPSKTAALINFFGWKIKPTSADKQFIAPYEEIFRRCFVVYAYTEEIKPEKKTTLYYFDCYHQFGSCSYYARGASKVLSLEEQFREILKTDYRPFLQQIPIKTVIAKKTLSAKLCKHYDEILAQAVAALGTTYSAELGLSNENAYSVFPSDDLFTRNTPNRKVFVLDFFSWDPEGAEEDEEEDEAGLRESQELAYAYAQTKLSEVLKNYPTYDYKNTENSKYPDDLADWQYFENPEKEDQEYRDSSGKQYSWCPYAEGGAIFESGEEHFEFKLWDIKNEYLVVQPIHVYGDGNYHYSVVITITPKIKL